MSPRDDRATNADELFPRRVTKDVRRNTDQAGEVRARAEAANRNAATLRAQAVTVQRRASEVQQQTQAPPQDTATTRGQLVNRDGAGRDHSTQDGDVGSEPGSASAEAEISEQLSAIAPEHMGWFRFYFDDQRWEWSDQVQRLHGYRPGTVTPTTELVLSHKHPDDRDKVAAAIDKITHTRGALSSRHRIIDAKGMTRWVVIIGDQFFDDNGAVIGTHGFYVDGAPAERARERMVTAKIDEIAGSRAPIEQAKGMLMLIYDINDEVAFSLLKWLSQENNVKLRVLAEQVCVDLRAVAATSSLDKTAFDHALMTAPQRLAG